MARKRPPMKEQAERLNKRYTPEELREVMQLTEGELRVLDLIARGRPPRNAIAVLKAIDLKTSLAYSKPKQEVEHSGNLTVSIQINRTVAKPDDKP